MRDGVGIFLVCTIRQFQVSINEVRICFREEFHFRVAHPRDDQAEYQQAESGQQYTLPGAILQAPFQSAAIPLLHPWPCALLETAGHTAQPETFQYDHQVHKHYKVAHAKAIGVSYQRNRAKYNGQVPELAVKPGFGMLFSFMAVHKINRKYRVDDVSHYRGRTQCNNQRYRQEDHEPTDHTGPNSKGTKGASTVSVPDSTGRNTSPAAILAAFTMLRSARSW